MPGFFDYLEQPPMPGLLQPAGASPDSLMAAMAAQRLPPLDELLRSGAGQPAPFYPSAPNWGQQRDPFAFAAPRQQPAGDTVLPSGAPPFVDTTPRIGKSLHRGDAGMYALLPVAARQSPDDQWLSQNAPFPTQARPTPPAAGWTDQFPVMDPADPGNYGPGSPFGRQPPAPGLLQQMSSWWDQRQQQPQAMPNQQYVRPGEHVYNTPLEPDQEKQFRAWLEQNKVPFDPSAQVTDYDMRGFWSALQKGDPQAVSAINPNDQRLHYPDYWKTPMHRSFSRDSQWATPDAPYWANDHQLVDQHGNVLFDERAR